MAIEKEETRKGPWNEQEDMQLVCYVGLFGERRWDFIAKVWFEGDRQPLIWRGWGAKKLALNPCILILFVGLNRTGKSCRLRWVNYLHPGLKRGRMTPQEERLVLQLHARWGNRWSHIARKLPGRTDNEIKNYWRTHMRKIAQEKKRAACPSASSSSVNTSEPPVEVNAERREFGTTSGSSPLTTTGSGDNEEVLKGYSMEQIWNEIEHINEAWNMNVPCPPMPSSIWECCPDTVWQMDVEKPKMFPPLGCGFLVPNYQFSG